jgi:PIN domain nuclease of toxin-antitoxin system
MRLLLDTRVLLWAAGTPQRLSREIAALLNDKANVLLFSAASIWEVCIKCSLGRSDFRVDAGILKGGLIDNGYLETPVTSRHAITSGLLPPIHKDPFDRVLVAQAIEEEALLLTADEVVARYPGPIRQIEVRPGV